MNKVELVSGGPDKPEQPDVFNLECAECAAETHGEAHQLVEDGWNWADTKVDGRQMGFALCPDHSEDEDLLDSHMNAYHDRLNRADEHMKQKKLEETAV